MKYKNVFMGSISAFAGILLLILVMINGIVIQDRFLRYTNHKYEIEKNLLMSSEELDKVTEKMVSYVKGQTESPQTVVEINGTKVDFFNDKELKHLFDVRELIYKLYGAMFVLFVVFVLGESMLQKSKAYCEMINGVFGAWGILLLFVLGIGVIALLDIDIIINGVHQIFLSNSNWVLNPSLDRSVWMFMTNMYQDVLIAMGLIIGTIAIVTITIAIVAKKYVKEK